MILTSTGIKKVSMVDFDFFPSVLVGHFANLFFGVRYVLLAKPNKSK